MQLYFIACTLPAPVSERINRLRYSLAREFECKHALKTPPHITLQPPFKIGAGANEITALLTNCKALLPVDIELSGFGFFEPRAAFIQVMANDRLNQLRACVCSGLLQAGITRNNRTDFHPHVTLAHRDIGEEQFGLMKNFLEQQHFNTTIPLDVLTLYRHSGKRWEACSVISA